jgi:hypothetical protein
VRSWPSPSSPGRPDQGTVLYVSVLEKLRRVRFPSFYRGDRSVESERSVENTDALAATGGRGMGPQGTGHPSFPPNYLKTDDGRPRH